MKRKSKTKPRLPKDPVIDAIKKICKEVQSYSIHRYNLKQMIPGDHLYSHVAWSAIKLADEATKRYQADAQKQNG